VKRRSRSRPGASSSPAPPRRPSTPAAITLGFEEREKVWNAGFFLQNVFDFSDKYFLTLGGRVDGHSAFGEGFGLQFYPKAGATWVMSDEDFWPDAWGDFRLRTAYGQSGRAPGAFDAVRTWNPLSWAGVPAFVPQNVGNPNLGPEVAVLQSADWGLDLGLGVTTNKSNVDSLCRDPNDELTCIPEFNDLNGRIMEGQPVPVIFDRRVANPNAVSGSWTYENDGNDVVIGPSLPTHFVTPSLTLRVPGNVVFAARGEYRGGHYAFVNPISIGRSVRSALCFPYYGGPFGLAGNGYATLELIDSTPDIWRERCTPSGGEDYWFDADYFKLRSVSATVPMDFAFPDRVSNATLTLALNNAWSWFREVPWYDVEVFGNDGAGDDGIGGSTERVPPPATFRMALRVTF
jgi:TonB-dependent starch-binding outer membrane protein SusC